MALSIVQWGEKHRALPLCRGLSAAPSDAILVAMVAIPTVDRRRRRLCWTPRLKLRREESHLEAKRGAGIGARLASRLALILTITAIVPVAAATLATNISVHPLTSHTLGLLVGIGASAAVIALVVGLALDDRRSRQLRTLRRSLRVVGTGEFERRLPPADDEDWGRVVADFNEMVTNLGRLFEEMERRQRETDLALRHLADELNALAVENGRLRAEAQKQVQSVSTLQEFSRSLTASSAADRICGQLLDALENELNFDIAYVALSYEDAPQGVPVAVADRTRNLRVAGSLVKELPSLQSLPGASLVGQVMGSAVPVRAANQEGPSANGLPHLHLLGIPLRSKDRCLGALVLAGSQPRAFSRQDERVATALAAQAAVAIENIRLFEEAGQVATLRELDRLKSELISTVSHELRTPLASIKGYISTLLRPDVSWDDGTRAEFLQIVAEESDRLQALIDNLLQMSRIDAGVLRINKQPVQLSRLAHKVARKARLRAPDHRVAVLFPNDMPEVAVDAAQMEQVLNNLVDNAIKYSAAGGRITIRGEVSDGNVMVSVSDDGIGISPQHLDRIFERFYRADTSQTKRIYGTGLGLSICRGIVEAHGGRIFAESTPGRGSTFTFVLPLEERPSDEVSVGATTGG